MRNKMTNSYQKYLQPIVNRLAKEQSFVNRNSTTSSHHIDEGDSPVYVVDTPQDSCLVEMEKVLSDPCRAETFEAVAKSGLVMENVTFLRAVMEYKKQCEDIVHEQSGEASNRMKDAAKKIIDQHIGATSEEEVNVSSRCAASLNKAWKDWAANIPIVSAELAQRALQEDSLKRTELFALAYKEISIMLYQNIWNKFRTIETQKLMATGTTSRDMFSISSVKARNNSSVSPAKSISFASRDSFTGLPSSSSSPPKNSSIRQGSTQESVASSMSSAAPSSPTRNSYARASNRGSITMKVEEAVDEEQD